jgi:hypothetical protein
LLEAINNTVLFTEKKCLLGIKYMNGFNNKRINKMIYFNYLLEYNCIVIFKGGVGNMCAVNVGSVGIKN